MLNKAALMFDHSKELFFNCTLGKSFKQIKAGSGQLLGELVTHLKMFLQWQIMTHLSKYFQNTLVAPHTRTTTNRFHFVVVVETKSHSWVHWNSPLLVQGWDWFAWSAEQLRAKLGEKSMHSRFEGASPNLNFFRCFYNFNPATRQTTIDLTPTLACAVQFMILGGPHPLFLFSLL